MADLGLAPTFQNDTAQNAYDVHLLVQRWDGELVDRQMDLSQRSAIDLKGHGLINELDVDKLIGDGVIADADRTATYYDFDSYSKAVTFDYNEAMEKVASVYNDIMAEVDPGQPPLRATQIDGVHDINNLHWEFSDYMLESAISSAEQYADMASTDDLAPLIEQANLAREDLANAGSSARGAAEIFFQDVKPPGPGIDPVEGVDLGQYEIPVGVPGASALEAKI